MNYLELAEELHVTNEEIKELIEDEKERMDADALTDMVASICEQANEDEQKIYESASPLAKILYIAEECYLRGYAMGLYIFNNVVNEYCKGKHDEVAKGV